MAPKKKPTPDAAAYEKLGAFYLGRREEGAATADTPPELLLYDAKDLTTHAVCVGMTGSGKTGLCISLLEEAALDGIPAIAIDLKGDIANLLLSFPDLKAEDFEPWIDPAEATRKGATVAQQAASTAKLWRDGLASWGQDGARIQRLRDAANFKIFTPGSDAGEQLCLLKSFTAPPPELVEDQEIFGERISTAVTGLLGLMGVDSDPLRSREHILLARILDHHWRAGRSLEVGQLIREIQAPPFNQIGVMDLETVYPEKDRLALSMSLNNLLAAPGMAGWMTGTPLEIPHLLRSDDGTPRLSILSIAHLNEDERMFFVTLLLNELVAWMRAQSGTGSLRALLYMDEVFGYLPPSANPPSKKPMLTLLKQARAYGVGVVLATQNPVDLDYKALSNTGTWFIGRLQTERDKLRVLDGLEGAALGQGAAFDRKTLDRTLSGLSSRLFLMNNVHDDGPVVFRSRWALSYLRGPLTRTQIKQLTAAEAKSAASKPATRPKPAKPVKTKAAKADKSSAAERPLLSPKIKESFLTATSKPPTNGQLRYRPVLLGRAELHYASSPADVDIWRPIACYAPLSESTLQDPWSLDNATGSGDAPNQDDPEEGATFTALPQAAADPKRYASWEKRFKTHLYRDRALELQRCKALKLVQKPEEPLADFKARLSDATRELRDLEMEKLRKRYAPKLASIQERIAKAEVRLQSEEADYSKEKWDTAISIGGSLLGALFGRKSTASISTSSFEKGFSRAADARGDVMAAKQTIQLEKKKLADLTATFEKDLASKRASLDPTFMVIDSLTIRPRKGDLAVSDIALVWQPWWLDENGEETMAFDLET